MAKYIHAPGLVCTQRRAHQKAAHWDNNAQQSGLVCLRQRKIMFFSRTPKRLQGSHMFVMHNTRLNIRKIIVAGFACRMFFSIFEYPISGKRQGP